MSTWREACQSIRPSTMVIPSRNCMLGPFEFEGPCKAAITIRAEGTLRAPSSLKPFNSQDGWIAFKNTDRLTVLGGGTFDGQGRIAWKNNNCAKTGSCDLPTVLILHGKSLQVLISNYNYLIKTYRDFCFLKQNMQLTGITNGLLHDITSLDSKMFHINIQNCQNIDLKNITIDASIVSLNTDGIHIGRSRRVNITEVDINTGDDCISLGDGSQHINIENVTCGLGHGISVGSLGKYRGEQPVVGITVRNCTLTNTTNGVRVKTWPNSYKGIAHGLHFEDIIMNNVSNPIIIGQNYCPSNLCKSSVSTLFLFRFVHLSCQLGH